MSCWYILEIEETTDKKLIKKAYAKALKQHHPEEDPEGFSRVRAAYEQALAYCKHQETMIIAYQPHESGHKRQREEKLHEDPKSYGINKEETEEREQKPYYINNQEEKEERKNREQKPYYINNQEEKEEREKREQKPYYISNEEENKKKEIQLEQRTYDLDNEEKIDVTSWFLQVEELYKDFNNRIQIKNWKALLGQILYLGVDEMPYVRNSLIDFLDKHYYLPNEVWQLLDDQFGFKEAASREALVKQKMLSNQSFRWLMEEIPLRYERFNGSINVDYDVIIKLYDEAYTMCENNHTQQAIGILDLIQEKGVQHPDFNILRTKCYIAQGEIEKAKTSIGYLETAQKSYFENYIRMLEEVNDRTFTMKRAEILLQQYPKSIPLLFKMGECYMTTRRYDKALECYDRITSCEKRNVRAYEWKIEIWVLKGMIDEVIACYQYLIRLFPTRLYFQDQLQKYETMRDQRRVYQSNNTLQETSYDRLVGKILGKYHTPVARRRMNILLLMGILSLASVFVADISFVIFLIHLGIIAIIGVSIVCGGKGTSFLVTAAAILGWLVASGEVPLVLEGEQLFSLWTYVLWGAFLRWGGLYVAR